MPHGYCYRGRHRAQPDRSGVARAVTVLALTAAPAAISPAAEAAPAAVWDRVAACESGGRWNVNTGNGYHGGLQFAPSTWRGYGGGQFAPAAHQASRAQQIIVAERVLAGQGWNAWPVCSRKAGAPGTAASVPKATAPPSDQPVKPVAVTQRPTTGTPVPDGYRVKPGDTLSAIAARYAVPGGFRTLAELNDIPDPDTLSVGLVLK